ncbi:MAG: nucleotidyltransferase family protein [Patescibacteria group bacterium]|nr:nucleotidyltransferase family protein [Patescibacteria group bacterium]
MINIISLFKKQSSFSLLADGVSMLPLLQPGDTVFYRKARIHSLKANDIVIAVKNNRIFIHRIIYKKGNYVITKGDNNLEADGKIYSRQIIGKIYQFKRQGKIVSLDSLYLFQSSFYFEELVKLNRVFEKNEINFLYLKGLPLHLYIEKSHPRRIYADADILIDKKCWKNSQKILMKIGYKLVNTSYSSLHKLLKDKDTEMLFYKKTDPFSVSLDVHLEAGFLFNQIGRLDVLYPQKIIDSLMEQFIKSKHYVKIQNIQFPILSHKWLIIYLSLHFYHHNFKGFYSLNLIDKLVRKKITNQEKNDWSDIGKEIIKFKLNNFIYPVLVLSKKYLKTPIPVSFFSLIKPYSGQYDYIEKNILPANLFNYETRIAAGIARFKNLFFLSPNPFWKKILVVLNIQVVYSVFWVMIFFLRRSFIKLLKSF